MYIKGYNFISSSDERERSERDQIDRERERVESV